MRLTALLVSMLTSGLVALPVRAEPDGQAANAPPAYASILYAEGDFDIVRVASAVPDPNDTGAPLGAGDQLTTRAGRLELVLPEGSRLWIDQDTRLDLMDLGPGPLLRLWGGAAALDVSGTASAATSTWPRVDTPAGSVFVLAEGSYRITASAEGFVHVTVEGGLAEVGGRRSSVLVRSGERTSVFPGDDPENAYVFNTASVSAFSQFVQARREATVERVSERVPDGFEGGRPGDGSGGPVPLYESQLAPYGDWRYDPSLETSVWYPRVASDWRPYHDGYWATYPEGPTWVSREPWGFVTYHYGGWEHRDQGGWCWVPGLTYSPAVVDFQVYDDYVGWFPSLSFTYVDHHGHSHRRDGHGPYDHGRGVLVRKDHFDHGHDSSVPWDRVRGHQGTQRDKLDVGDVLPAGDSGHGTWRDRVRERQALGSSPDKLDRWRVSGDSGRKLLDTTPRTTSGDARVRTETPRLEPASPSRMTDPRRDGGSNGRKIIDTAPRTTSNDWRERWNAPRTEPASSARVTEPGRDGSGGRKIIDTAPRNTSSDWRERWNAPRTEPASPARVTEPGRDASGGRKIIDTAPRTTSSDWRERWNAPRTEPATPARATEREPRSQVETRIPTRATTDAPAPERSGAFTAEENARRAREREVWNDKLGAHRESERVRDAGQARDDRSHAPEGSVPTSLWRYLHGRPGGEGDGDSAPRSGASRDSVPARDKLLDRQAPPRENVTDRPTTSRDKLTARPAAPKQEATPARESKSEDHPSRKSDKPEKSRDRNKRK